MMMMMMMTVICVSAKITSNNCCEKLTGLIDFNGVSTYQDLFYAITFGRTIVTPWNQEFNIIVTDRKSRGTREILV